MAKLTAKQQCFVDEYLIDLNATQAAIRAGYSPKSASRIGIELLNKTHVAEAIQRAMKNREQRTNITQDQVLQELAKIAFSSGADFAKVVTNKRIHCFANEETGEIERREVDVQTVILEDTDSLPADKKAAIAGIKETKNGIVIESCDKIKALELLGRHLGMFKDKVELSGQINNPYEDLTTEELKKLIRDG